MTRDLDTLNKPLSILYFGLLPGGDSGSSNKLDNLKIKAKTKIRRTIKPPSPTISSSPLEDLKPADL